MGTNYYRKNIISESDKEELKGYIDRDEFDILKDRLDSLERQVHICKMSAGWITCFDHNWGAYYDPSRKSLEEFLFEPGTVIIDEYGKEISFLEFWKLVDSRDKVEGAWDSDSYDKWEKSRNPSYTPYPCVKDRIRCKDQFGIECTSDDFKVDGLRFAVFSDFS